MTRALMIQGTGSDVGKSLIVAGLARVFTRRGLRVRPFKPQNMSNNAAVTADGGEIGRAQALQARAARVAPSVHMNPVLLKPQSDVGAQVIVQGHMVGTAKAREYQSWKPRLLASVIESFEHLKGEADIVLVEGAGSPAEINLRKGDIANMGFARATDTPVVLVGDIDRGGVIASLVGTKTVIGPDDAAMIRGFIVNRFRGDPSLFADGMAMIAEATGWTPFGLVPHFHAAARLPAEDAMALGPLIARTGQGAVVAVPVLPHIANFDDLDPLRQEPGVEVVWVRPGEAFPGNADLILLPGSKTTIDDFLFVQAQGWDVDIRAHVRRGGRVIGLCGGFQMLGQRISDPDGIEGEPRSIEGLGLLDVETVMTPAKRLVAVAGSSLADGVSFAGYEMHVGDTSGPDAARPLLRFADGRPDGAVSADGLVSGTYVHGLFADDCQRAAWLMRLGAPPGGASYEAGIETVLDAFADHLEAHLDCDGLLALAAV
ncbi:cobyric acid synthase [Methylobacterium sp. C25]|uniref:cobyric acid synthase n=1 Tax=Methylobacterium sp. C25 TaxID=2721622 RepID=UPI001F25848C|nr:cobyric acid synthase [Methylobacterium sp. C25]